MVEVVFLLCVTAWVVVPEMPDGGNAVVVFAVVVFTTVVVFNVVIVVFGVVVLGVELPVLTAAEVLSSRYDVIRA